MGNALDKALIPFVTKPGYKTMVNSLADGASRLAQVQAIAKLAVLDERREFRIILHYFGGRDLEKLQFLDSGGIGDLPVSR